jgi:hypothetical protein
MPRNEDFLDHVRDGVISGIGGVLYSLIAYYFLDAFVQAGVVSSAWLGVYDLLNIVLIALFIHSTPYWGTGYLFGWWLGFGIMWYAGLVGNAEFGLCSFALVIVLISRAARRLT